MAKTHDKVMPATHVAHWATGPVPCCEEHCRQIVGLGNFMGAHVAVTVPTEDADCTNCANEHKDTVPHDGQGK